MSQFSLVTGSFEGTRENIGFSHIPGVGDQIGQDNFTISKIVMIFLKMVFFSKCWIFSFLYSKTNSNFLKVNQLTKIMFAWTLMSVRISMMVKKYAQMVGVSIGILDIFAFAIRDSYHHKIRKHASMPGRVRLRMDFQVLI